MTRWTRDDIPDLTGKRVMITGSNSGTGFEAAKTVAAKGGSVIMAARNAEKAHAAIQEIQRETPAADVTFEVLDLSKQASVSDFAARLLADGRAIDILINNAGVMALPTREVTEDGFEMQLATNYLGHFALTVGLMPLLKSGRARVVQLSSIAHRQGRIRLDDLNHEQGYRPWPVYAQSKLAMLMFGLELDRRSTAGHWGITSVVAHPGFARTALIANGPLVRSPITRTAMRYIVRPFIESLISHSAAAGAMPILMAATDGSLQGGAYIGPTRLNELKGPPGPAKINPQALDADIAARLWTASEQMTGVTLA